MKLKQHIAISVPISIVVWLVSDSGLFTAMTFFLGCCVDVDHVFDYVREEKTFSLKGLFVKSYRRDFVKLVLVLHSYEYLFIIWLVCLFGDRLGFGIIFTIGYLAHMVPDQLTNGIRPLGYFFSYRAKKKFEVNKIFFKK